MKNSVVRLGKYVTVFASASAFVCAASNAGAQTPNQQPPTQTPSTPTQPMPSQPRPTPPSSTPKSPTQPPSGQGTGTMAKSEHAAADTASAKFIKSAAQDGDAEIALAAVVNTQSQNADVKALAEKIKSDHTKANEELQSIATSRQVTLPTEPSAAQKSLHDRLSKLSGAAFDRAYVNAMVKDHQTAVAEFTKEAKSSDPDVKAFAEKTLPALQDHLQRAQTLQRQIGGAGTGAEKDQSGTKSVGRGGGAR